jgi:hypothetical protein
MPAGRGVRRATGRRRAASLDRDVNQKRPTKNRPVSRGRKQNAEEANGAEIEHEEARGLSGRLSIDPTSSDSDSCKIMLIVKFRNLAPEANLDPYPVPDLQ